MLLRIELIAVARLVVMGNMLFSQHTHQIPRVIVESVVIYMMAVGSHLIRIHTETNIPIV